METKGSSSQYIQIEDKEDVVLNTKWLLRNIYRKKRAIIFLSVLLFFLIQYMNTNIGRMNTNIGRMNTNIGRMNTNIERISVIHFLNVSTPGRYLVWGDNCKMPDIDPYSPEVMKFVERKEFEECPPQISLTQVVFNTTVNKYILFMNEEGVKNLTAEERLCLICCYRVITRVNEDVVRHSTCFRFKEPVTLPVDTEHIVVWCRNGRIPLYYNGYSMMPERDELRKLINDWKSNDLQKRLNVILLGIDSISRANLKRAMPLTAQYLNDNDWFEMSGYNKIGLNTFPNLMAALTGFNESTVAKQCNPAEVGGLDRCPFIWKTFKEHGYVTAYAEDSPTYSTFNYIKTGFNNLPVDYYFRPFILGAEIRLPVKKRSSVPYCIGSKPEAFYVFDYALELDARYGNDSYFGLFWTNICHGDINDASMIDDSFVEYLRKFADRGILERSVIIFFSDHGMRWGPARRTISGYFEERLPFLFIWLPPWLRYTNPDFVKVLRMNNNRLTSPYDLHMTLKHILEISSRSKNLPHAQDCPNCQSLLKVVPDNRSCVDAAIPELWCSCSALSTIDNHSYKVKKIADFSIIYINEIINIYNDNLLINLPCKKHFLSKITSALTYTNNTTNYINYVIVFWTSPSKAVFEAVVKYFLNTGHMEMIGVSRVCPETPSTYFILDSNVRPFC